MARSENITARMHAGKGAALAVGMLLALGLSSAAEENQVRVDAGYSLTNWRFHDGGEFPGAKGSLKLAAEAGGGLRLAYDFSGGGSYVAANYSGALPPQTTKLKVKLNLGVACRLQGRFCDRSGRWFQGQAQACPAGDYDYELDRSGPWTAAWGGDNQAKAPGELVQFSLMATNDPDQKGQAGEIMIRELSAVSSAPAEQLREKLELAPFTQELRGWRISGEWLPQWRSPTLRLRAEGGTAPGEFSLRLAVNGRARVLRRMLDPAKPAEPTDWPLPVADGGNPRNVYRLELQVVDAAGTDQRIVSLAGILAADQNLGRPISSRELPASRFGTCAHFSYGRNPAFSGWFDYARLLDEMSACGFKWVRDGVSLEKLENGEFKLADWDRQWITAARERGIESILVLHMDAKYEIPELLARAKAVLAGTTGLVKVFELGNEPNNFGNWRQKYPGTWNGKEEGNATSQWVLEHLKHTNALAEFIKKERPDAITIGLGACVPTNFRYLDAGVSPALDGVVEHPYAFSLPPEKVPYGWGHEKRDGVRVGDNYNSFAGLINSYHDKFAALKQPRSLWVTEFGYTSYWFNGGNEKGLYAGYSEPAQAAYLVRRFILGLTLPIEVSCQYDFRDDYGSDPKEAEANFGLLRGDGSRKPAFYAIQRINSLLGGWASDSEAKISITAEPLHRALQRGELIHDWDEVAIKSTNGVMAFGFKNPAEPNVRHLAVWSALPFSGEFNNRMAEVEIDGWKEFTEPPVAIDLVSGDTFDVKLENKDGKLRLDKLCLGNMPLLIKLFR